MVKCVNNQCQNHQKELDEKTEICPLCGTQTEKVTSNVNSNFHIASFILAILSVFAFWTSWGGITMAIGVIMSVASIVLGFISKKKLAIIVSIISLLSIIVPTVIMWFE